MLELEFVASAPTHGLTRELVHPLLERLLVAEGVLESHISLAIVGDAESHRVNLRFLEHNEPTDVLSFRLSDDGESLEGEILINSELAERRSAEFGWGPRQELLLYLIHGTLHLVGYEDDRPELREIMFARQRAILEAEGFSSDLIRRAVP
ncbi:MAG TPA: rRNA maturation RNase YbeY [Pirellulaceae bacterium]